MLSSKDEGKGIPVIKHYTAQKQFHTFMAFLSDAGNWSASLPSLYPNHPLNMRLGGC
jgi:hypothetical protein